MIDKLLNKALGITPPKVWLIDETGEWREWGNNSFVDFENGFGVVRVMLGAKVYELTIHWKAV